ncbi:unnamed protein product [Lampetra fluviatilis]
MYPDHPREASVGFKRQRPLDNGPSRGAFDVVPTQMDENNVERVSTPAQLPAAPPEDAATAGDWLRQSVAGMSTTMSLVEGQVNGVSIPILLDTAAMASLVSSEYCQTMAEIRSFLGLVSYYRRFVKGFGPELWMRASGNLIGSGIARGGAPDDDDGGGGGGDGMLRGRCRERLLVSVGRRARARLSVSIGTINTTINTISTINTTINAISSSGGGHVRSASSIIVRSNSSSQA